MHQVLPKQVFMGDAFETFHERYQQERSMADQTQQKQKRARPKKTWHGGRLDTGAQKLSLVTIKLAYTADGQVSSTNHDHRAMFLSSGKTCKNHKA
jgi:hypothetical protein